MATVELRRVETIYQGYVTLLLATLAGADGKTFRRESEHHGRAACVLPYDPERQMALLVNPPRAPVIWAGGPPGLLEAPAGMVAQPRIRAVGPRPSLAWQQPRR